MNGLPYLTIVASALALLVGGIAIAHVILHKRDVRAAIGWVGLVLVNPLLGAAAYGLFGINRIRRRAARLTRDPSRVVPLRGGPFPEQPAIREVVARFGSDHGRLARTVQRATGRPLLIGNRVEPLVDGDQAYPRMLAAIDAAERSVVLATYIFDNDPLGLRFVEALAAAAARDVIVRVLIDGVGARYSRPSIVNVLRQRGVTTEVFLPTRIPFFRHPYLNLRNHRKLLLVDGRTAFAGGLNIRAGCLLAQTPANPVQDLHFELTGPVVEPLFQIVAEDWQFAAGEILEGPPWQLEVAPVGTVAMQAFGDGPDEDFETLRWTLLAGLAAAKRSIRLATPYFLPDAQLLAGLRLAALRGVEVDILLPEVSNLRFVQWASMAQLWQVLEPGCQVWLVPPPFDHSKVLVVDDDWSLVGSANWDMRSVRLNFELGVACFDHDLAASLLRLIERKKADGRRLTLAEVDGRSLFAKLRDGAVRLLAPYL